MIGLRYEGLRELAQALRTINYELYAEVVAGLREVGEVIRKDARNRFVTYGAGGSEARAATFVQAADGFQTLVRPNTSTMAIVSVSQTRRRTGDLPRRRSNFGDLMMRKALLPARGESMDEAAAVMEAAVGGLLAKHGF